ncbi:hypothetical protein NQT69_06105 [Pseudoalteromonas shioyasakiensis]|uniref:hypothetical protein n=1 Tax=Pseudoalteromonas shioyasakiensis TaxID=1190813 RepID=UPI00211979DF|nr:hypothetical protein [Pseudoalteromonas shioyasakiensis]MCQ8877598.1 hypothetical protein [Pseudoalteromonas shioyasakiensis]
MNEKKSLFIRQYVRASKSPWDDSSTLLLLADVIEQKTLEFSFTRYIYCHRDAVGNVLGVSISKALLDDNPEFSGRYLEGVEMFAFLILYLDEIAKFCELFAEEFALIFMLPPAEFFSLAEVMWLKMIE